MKKILSIVTVLATYPVGVLLAFGLIMLCLLRFLRIKHWARFPHFKRKMILVANHPSMIDPFLMTALFFKGYLANPFRYAPLLVADKGNFYDSWWFFWLRPFMISVDRGSKKSQAAAFLRMKKVLDRGGIVIIYPEGRRTRNGKNFSYSHGGQRMGELQEGIGLLIATTGADVLPVWIKGTDEFFPNKQGNFFLRFRIAPIVVKIGNILYFQKKDLQKGDSKKITKMISNHLLLLADS